MIRKSMAREGGAASGFAKKIMLKEKTRAEGIED
jgi:hypothetical protein